MEGMMMKDERDAAMVLKHWLLDEMSVRIMYNASVIPLHSGRVQEVSVCVDPRPGSLIQVFTRAEWSFCCVEALRQEAKDGNGAHEENSIVELSGLALAYMSFSEGYEPPCGTPRAPRRRS